MTFSLKDILEDTSTKRNRQLEYYDFYPLSSCVNKSAEEEVPHYPHLSSQLFRPYSSDTNLPRQTFPPPEPAVDPWTMNRVRDSLVSPSETHLTNVFVTLNTACGRIKTLRSSRHERSVSHEDTGMGLFLGPTTEVLP